MVIPYQYTSSMVSLIWMTTRYWIFLVIVFHWTLVCSVWPNYEVVEFQPQSVTAPDLVSVAYCCILKCPALSHLPLLPSNFPPREIPSLDLSANTVRFPYTQYHPTTRASPVPVPAYHSCANSTLGHILPPPVTPLQLLSPTLPLFYQNFF